MIKLKMSIRGVDDIVRRFLPSFDKGIVEGLRESIKIVQTTSKQMAPFATGKLRNSILTDVMPKPFDFPSAIIGSDVIYARIHELGGTIRPKHGKYLVFKSPISGEFRFATSVRIAKKAYLARSFEFNATRISDTIIGAIETSMERL